MSTGEAYVAHLILDKIELLLALSDFQTHLLKLPIILLDTALLCSYLCQVSVPFHLPVLLCLLHCLPQLLQLPLGNLTLISLYCCERGIMWDRLW